MKQEIKNILIPKETTILQCLKRMDSVGHRLLIVSNDEHFIQLVSIGDIQRAIINGVSLNEPVSNILRERSRVASVHDNLDVIKEIMLKRKNEFMPILDDQKKIVNVLFWSDLFKEERNTSRESLNLPVVIMAGGQGVRLRPLTNVLPKPLIPIGEQTMIEDIMCHFISYGCDQFYISLNYKSDMIKHYLQTQASKSYNMLFFKETKPLGTGGSLSLLKGQLHDTFFVSNCDIIINDDYAEMIKFHRNNQNEITIIAAIKSVSIPYGTLQIKDGLLESITEKPEYSFYINTGMYILEPHLLEEIPCDDVYHITYLIEKLCKEGRRVGVFPISEGTWTDIGNWDEYVKFLK